ncbi:uncharacterized protein ACHE_10429S [Aspergillus chevalieri]|uniref:Ubiquinone biosynthesis protein n=1 Tax=Aspergillus chevalieri TaxID=182096 RepID=A0A7R7ZJH3_ASPCH|nr:ubiquinone biosynthesis protein Coq9, mitochondrial [Aspergillus chevalieri]BCR83027.1 ubiquinone biosynthesis protein Coq9, mitochondrial [Aspergillus chevalieri]
MAQPFLLSLPRRGLTPSPRLSLTSPSRTIASCSRFTPTRPQHHYQPHQPQQPQLLQRNYHSENHPSTPPQENEYSNSQLTILSAALAHVPRHGFSRDALILGARDSGFLDVSVQLLPRGEFDLVLFWLASRRGLLRDVAEKLKGKEMGVEKKVRCLVMERLRMNEMVKTEWQGVSSCPSFSYNKSVIGCGEVVLTDILCRRWHLCPSLEISPSPSPNFTPSRLIS